ncbi:major facilitator superfamily protein [Sphingobium sp. SYK-6]|uniref:MFS transporter n=1 Tax=Sphingobium sp. (strain NBRC 103272 / SYK-6) TaxID=627192 RepID=UPI000227690B|nr:MFS transporter [Sphingobium sp. SYK-6]BAK65331.1 major facilitator superfamily protein [Sphingobium sp. SYK-6]
MSMPDDVSTSETQRAEERAALARARATAIVLAGTMFMVGIDSTTLITALPRMGADFGVPATTLSTTITIYILVSAALQPLSRWIGERFGSRRVFLTAIVGFTLSSVGAGFSPDLTLFLAARVSQAAFASLMIPVGNIVQLTITPRHYLVTAMTISSTPALVAPVLGPPLGGFITTFVDWRWIFFLNVPTGLLALAAALRFIPRIPAAARTPFDLRGFAVTAGFLCAFIGAMDRFGQGGNGPRIGAALLVAATGFGFLAWRHARTAPHPIVPLTPLRHPCFFAATIGAGNFVRIPFMAMSFTLPLMLQIGLALTPFQAGMLLLAQNAGDLALKTIASRALRRLGFRTALVSGSISLAVSLLVCAALPPGMPFWLLFAIMIGVGMARSILFTALMPLRFADMPQSEIGGATVLGSLSNSLAQAVAISGAAALLGLLAGQADAPSLPDFRLAILILAAMAACAAPLFARLPRDAGAELTGRVRRGRPAIGDPERGETA